MCSKEKNSWYTACMKNSGAKRSCLKLKQLYFAMFRIFTLLKFIILSYNKYSDFFSVNSSLLFYGLLWIDAKNFSNWKLNRNWLKKEKNARQPFHWFLFFIKFRKIRTKLMPDKNYQSKIDQENINLLSLSKLIGLTQEVRKLQSL